MDLLSNWKQYGLALGSAIGLWLFAYLIVGTVFFWDGFVRPYVGLSGLDPVIDLLISGLLTSLGFAIAAVFYAYATRRSEIVSLEKPSRDDVRFGLSVSLIVFLLIIVATALFTYLGEPPAKHAHDVGDNPEYLLYMLVPMLLIAIPIEELLYRATIQGRLRETFSAPTAIGLATAIYLLPLAVAHQQLSLGVVGILVVSGLIGAGAGYVYEKTGNIFASAFVHGLYDTAIVVLLYLSTVGVIASSPL